MIRKILNSKYLLAVIIFSLVYLPLRLEKAIAQSTPSAEEVSTESAKEDEEKVKDIRDALKEKVKEKVEEKIEEVKTRANKKGFFGELKEIAENILTVEALSGERLAKVDEDTEIVLFDKGKKETIKFEDLALGNFAIVMGYATQNGTVEAKRIVVTKKAPESTRREALFGIIQSIDKTSIILKNPNDETHQIKTDKKTEIEKKTNDKFEDIEVDNLSKGDTIIVAGQPSKADEKILVATKIRVLLSKEPEKEEEEEKTEEPGEEKAKEATPSSKESPEE